MFVRRASQEGDVPKAVRKDFFQWSADDIERVLPKLLDNMRFSDVRLLSAKRELQATTTERATMGQYTLDLQLQLGMKWTEQNNGLTVIITVEEGRNEWAGCLVNRMSDSLIGALKTICEIQRGSDS